MSVRIAYSRGGLVLEGKGRECRGVRCDCYVLMEMECGKECSIVVGNGTMRERLGVSCR